ncbi:Major facilitator superfamily domain, general substrate transporter [Phaffia rhodozyma]|uniref:Major facilitator superfamily domain, general substrate transporter n=1 Tax=Phaffia rhodozyma TaxID=264483 RepID=A0A0F7SJK6_PHARH|nr:Major facilitator superfamily domain, general substrate transporter [Phaffia rhodozyma]
MGYFKNLIPTIPSKADRQTGDDEEQVVYNPFKIFAMISPISWALYASGWFAWTMDAFDFFAVSLSLTRLSEAFDKSTHALTTSITLTLLFRSLGAVLFGIIADRYGRKWTLVTNLCIIAALQLGSGFIPNGGFKTFLAVRSLFGVAMGGIWGTSAATALEGLPVQTRGLMSGILQQGYAAGYLFACCVNLTVVQTSPHHWRVLFWIGSGLSLLAAIFRAVLPESAIFLQARAEQRAAEAAPDYVPVNKTKVFFHELGQMLKAKWINCILAVMLMAGFNFLSHGSQDLYPTYLQVSKGFTPHSATLATIVGNCGAITGGMLAGYISQFLGRRLTIILFICFIGCMIPVWIIPTSFGGLAAGAFLVQFGVQGAWGVIPVYLNELSPPAFRGTFPGVAYQLGNMISSAAAQIETTAGESLKTVVEGKTVPDYAKIQGILIGVVAAWTIIFTILNGENHGSHFESAKVGFQQGAGAGELASAHLDSDDRSFDGEKGGAKGETYHHERV